MSKNVTRVLYLFSCSSLTLVRHVSFFRYENITDTRTDVESRKIHWIKNIAGFEVLKAVPMKSTVMCSRFRDD
jgi:hypothetical protein